MNGRTGPDPGVELKRKILQIAGAADMLLGAILIGVYFAMKPVIAFAIAGGAMILSGAAMIVMTRVMLGSGPEDGFPPYQDEF